MTDDQARAQRVELPTDRPRVSGAVGERAEHVFTVPDELSADLLAFCRGNGVQPAALLLSVFAVLLANHSGQEQIAVTLSSPADSVVTADLAGDPAFGSLLRSVAGSLTGTPERFATADLDLAAELTDAEITLRLGYRADLFDASTAARMAGHYLTLLAAVAADQHSPCSRLDMLTKAERHQLLVEWNSTPAVEPPAGIGVHQLVARQAAATPEATALVFGERTVSYHELDARSSQLAHQLVRLGVGPDVPVGVCTQRGPDTIVAVLAVLKAGGAYLPLDPGYPAERVAFMIHDAGAGIVLTEECLRGLLPAPSVRIVCLDGDPDNSGDPGPDEQPAGAPDVPYRPDSVAYLLYTSGSTGEPKGVQVTNAGLVNLVLAIREVLPVSAPDTVLAVTPATFDIFNAEYFLALANGARVVIAGKEQVHSPQAIAELIEQYGISLVQTTPSAWRPIVEALPSGGERLTILAGGEPLTADLVERMRRVAARVVNGYGPTETTVYSTVADLSVPGTPITIGRPVGGTEIYVVDRFDRLVPIGVPGELLIGGRGVSRGYLNRPELTKQRFTADPFSADPARRVYRTGDIVRWRLDGMLDYVGRIDHQVKIRGFRVELGEIESTLSGHPDVRACAVTAHQDAPGQRRLVGYCVLRPGAQVGLSTLREWCARVLPDYMVPAVFVLLDEIPLSPNGKVDRAALPAPDADRMEPSAIFVAPRTAAERAVARIWAKALYVEQVGAHEDFFELGGDSLLATRMSLQLREEFGVDVPVGTLFRLPTVEELAAAITSALRAQRSSVA